MEQKGKRLMKLLNFMCYFEKNNAIMIETTTSQVSKQQTKTTNITFFRWMLRARVTRQLNYEISWPFQPSTRDVTKKASQI